MPLILQIQQQNTSGNTPDDGTPPLQWVPRRRKLIQEFVSDEFTVPQLDTFTPPNLSARRRSPIQGVFLDDGFVVSGLDDFASPIAFVRKRWPVQKAFLDDSFVVSGLDDSSPYSPPRLRNRFACGVTSNDEVLVVASLDDASPTAPRVKKRWPGPTIASPDDVFPVTFVDEPPASSALWRRRLTIQSSIADEILIVSALDESTAVPGTTRWRRWVSPATTQDEVASVSALLLDEGVLAYARRYPRWPISPHFPEDDFPEQPIPPSPPVPPIPVGGPGGPPFVDEYWERIEYRQLVRVDATYLRVDVHATMLHVEVVERGNLVYFTAFFAGKPDEVHFVYVRPGENRPIADPGFGQPGSKIARIGDGTYVTLIDTTGWKGGTLRWHLWGTGAYQASQFGEVKIPDRLAQLL